MLAPLLALASGALVGLTLGLIGGGGSILAVPLLLYVVGVADPHVAIGTSAVAVAVSAFANLALHARSGTVKWPCAAAFAMAGVAGALVGAEFGKRVDGSHLLVLFALIMLVVAIAMLRRRDAEGDPGVRINPRIAVRLLGIGFLTGLLSGFFGIGGGFLIVPGIMLGSGMAMLNAVGSSLFSVGAFGLTTAASYAVSGLVDWTLAGLLVAGGIAGGVVGLRLAVWVAPRKGLMGRLFAGVLVAVAGSMLWRGL